MVGWFQLLAAACFVLVAALQYNDPDPYVWIAIYGAAALVSWLQRRRPARSIPAVLVGLFCAGALAASMSSGDAMAHAAASIAVRDGVVRALGRPMEPAAERRDAGRQRAASTARAGQRGAPLERPGFQQPK